MKNMTQNYWALLFIVFILVAGTGYAFKNSFDNKAKAYISISLDNVAEQEKLIANLQNGLRTGGDSYSSAVSIADCSRESRSRFDTLLSGLAQLSRPELEELDELFNDCAYYYATIQTVSAVQLTREVAVYEDMLRAVAIFDKTAEGKLEASAKWSEIITKENERSALHKELVTIQQQIVEELLSYKQIGHPEVTALVNEGQEIRNNIIFLTQQIDELRNQLKNS